MKQLFIFGSINLREVADRNCAPLPIPSQEFLYLLATERLCTPMTATAAASTSTLSFWVYVGGSIFDVCFLAAVDWCSSKIIRLKILSVKNLLISIILRRVEISELRGRI